MNKKLLLIIVFGLVASLCVATAAVKSTYLSSYFTDRDSAVQSKHDEYGGQDEHEGHGGHEGEHSDEGKYHAELTAKQRSRIKLEVAIAGSGTIVNEAAFPGETILNPDQVVHVVPRASGIAREVAKTLGDYVEAGEILAWIESDELVEAKLSFYAKEAEVGCCMIKVPRAKEIFENTAKLLDLLNKEATREELHKLDGLEMGKYRAQLLPAYAEYLATREIYEREKTLRTKEISSAQELLKAETAYKKAREQFFAAIDTARYETLIAYIEAVQERLVAEFGSAAAERRLRLKGADDDVVAKLRRLVPKIAGLKPCICNDPNCQEGKLPSVGEALGKDRRFAWYAIRAPFAGFLIKKHLTIGENVTGEESVFSIADTSSVWVRFNVYQKDLATVKPDQQVRVDLGVGLGSHIGTIAYVSPIIDEKTRTMQARVVLDNKDNTFRPGLYVTVHVTANTQNAPIVIPKSAVQVLDEKEVVFVEDSDGFEAIPVKLGISDRKRVIVKSGLSSGQRYVKHGAFELKAKIVSGGLGAHAGHGH